MDYASIGGAIDL